MRISSQILISIVVGFSLAVPAPPINIESNTVEGKSVDSGDIASEFLSSLIANASQANVDDSSKDRRSQSSLQVNLGYAKYKGYYDSASDLNVWKGIRYAAAPIGNLRWQPPRFPATQPSAQPIPATDFGPICPQAYLAVPGVPSILGNEDCLFLNVYAPSNASRLPVLVYIHGGGYGFGDGTLDMSGIVNSNDNNFIAVTIQYRLGAFGFLSSQEVKSKGVVNAGLLDQAFALLWIKLFIGQFGGDPLSITISGDSAGGSSVLYHDMAAGGSLGTLLFNQGIAASPYLPFQYTYNAAWPTARYYAFSAAAGCPGSGNVFSCLIGKDTVSLQNANIQLAAQQTYGFWAFYPVRDNVYITGLPSQQLKAKKVNGKKLLVGNNANEGPLFVPPSMSTIADITNWLHAEFPNLSDAQINSILAVNPNNANTTAGPLFETSGVTGLTAVNVSQDANGQQQRANNIYAEATFVCPSYWMASAYTSNGRRSWHYQFSVPFASHTTDMNAYFGPSTPNLSTDFILAFRRIWGNFITKGDPSITNAIANGASSSNPNAANGASTWPAWTETSPKQLNLNETGGVPYSFTTQWGVPVTQFQQPGLRNAISVVPADTWEGGRGTRCNFYQTLASSIPV
ncbi:hypothetical protein N5P37_011240 [Trichoderma harzianum]|uniref:Carboxylic ester hydrolase n=1 Tax=Trichoderma harzianum CBS 226.95 TaxID=983964 RepID=A0A2T3ZVT1_TRIHA|nr:hypothetical protein M431DRAFT_20889 [Trichoderma harzianum CBS 226.95]KAK0756325.1 hypothetical protein N5P37_011240 [Trichoderma harzianum]PKK54615.1 hypothetical protein CI102_902 [Trichoderma harzianum]PTB48925.1 hypothetical protein M431DRAFT_20889 [Trichoderma harzianum CBS 226.95]